MTQRDMPDDAALDALVERIADWPREYGVAKLRSDCAVAADAITALRARNAALQAGAAAIRAEALEEAAMVAYRAETEFWEDWKGGADPHDQGKSDGATEVASRIRALIEQPAEGGGDG